MKNLFLFSLICLISGIHTFAQNDTINQNEWKQDTIVRGQFDFFHVDMIGNMYTVKDDVIKKYNSRGDTLFTQSIKFFGEITALDVGQSFKPILFYKDQQALIYLDNTLTQNTEIQLEQKGIYLAELITLSYTQNTTWIFDQSNSSLRKFDVNLNQIVIIENLAQQLNQDFEPTFLKEYNDYLYLNNPKEGVLVFDLFGSYIKTLPIKNATYMDVDNNNVFYIKNKQLFVYNQKTFDETKITMPVNEIKGFGVSRDRFYFHDEEGVKVYLR